MNWFTGVINGLGEVWAHKLRSALTIACVLLGVASMVVTTGFMEGLFETWKVSLDESGGLEKLSSAPDAVPERQKPLTSLSSGLTLDDARAVKALIPGVRFVSPEIDLSNAQLTRGNRRTAQRVQGVENDIFEINRYEIVAGRPFSDLDQRDASNVVIIGTKVFEELFEPQEDPVGQYINVNGRPFLVIGLLKNYELYYGSYNVMEGKNRIAFIPVSTMAIKLQNTVRLSWLNHKIDDVARLDEAVDAVQNLYYHRHRGVLDFKVDTQQQQLASYNQMKTAFVLGGAAVAGVSLLVSGIGIMNLMLASINERVREIGVRKAVGASPFNIFCQFLAEAVTLSLLGGILGITVAVGVIEGLQAVLPSGSRPLLVSSAFFVGFAFSVTAGVLAGVYPAIQAARLDPIEALRYE
ncbi:ABC transporter permease [Rariglobus hedericola]|uniref:FtsX-like permease family protein n=1 Tax=Rariglobus hedericola TaxID=2597822 RepID=A0A556QQX2_9BACT|nr:ABC transporter permease [Rariglobus hedericola]TSJ79036.1 FtsX-like permease family protein [Rariglobus hedericola]